MATIDKFQIIAHLGRGNFGDVYHCYDPLQKKEVAIKVIRVPDPVKFAKAVKEGRMLDICRHPHTVDVKDVRSTLFNSERVVILVMEYLANGSVEKRIENRFISTKESCKIIQQTLLGLEQAHNNNVLHRDVKPGNIMFGDNGDAKLSDFGLAIESLAPGSTFGYRPHQPLEVIEGNPMDELSDIYAMGITFYRLLNNTNNLPFPFLTQDEWRKAVKKDLYPVRQYLLHIPEKAIKVLNKAIQKDKVKQFQNCKAFRQAIEKLNFYIDWIRIDDDNWVGNSNGDTFTISKYLKKRSGWFIDFKKNGIRKNEHCSKGVPDHKVEEEFFKVIRETSDQS